MTHTTMRIATRNGLVVLAVLLAAGVLAGCSDECKRDDDCSPGYICFQGSCQQAPGADADADGDDAPPPDDGTGPDGDADADVEPDVSPDGDVLPDEGGGPDADADDGWVDETEPDALYDDAPTWEEYVVRCGDGFHDPSEECDDGNTTAGDGCEPDCTFTCTVHSDCADDGNPCTGSGLCDPSFHTCVFLPDPTLEGTECGSGDLCSGNYVCERGVCTHTPGLDCDDHADCTVDSCNPATGDCEHRLLPAGTSCDDGVFCTGNDQCWGTPHCFGLVGEGCDDGIACTRDVCDEAGRTCVHEAPTYRAMECGGGGGGDLSLGSNEFHDYTCPDGRHAATGNDEVQQVVVTGTGNLTVTVNTSRSAPGTQIFVLRDPCNLTSCIGRTAGTTSVAVTPGTYYLVAETPGRWAAGVTCP